VKAARTEGEAAKPPPRRGWGGRRPEMTEGLGFRDSRVPLGDRDENALMGLMRLTPDGLRTPPPGACPGSPPPWQVGADECASAAGDRSGDGFESFTREFEEALRRGGLERDFRRGEVPGLREDANEEEEGEMCVAVFDDEGEVGEEEMEKEYVVLTPSARERQEAMVKARNSVMELRVMSEIDKAQRQAEEAEAATAREVASKKEAEARADKAQARAVVAEERVREVEDAVVEERAMRMRLEERLRHAQKQWEWCAGELERAGEREKAVGDEAGAARKAAEAARGALELQRLEAEAARGQAEQRVGELEGRVRELEGIERELRSRLATEDGKLSLGATKVALKDAQARITGLEEELRQAHAKALASEIELRKTKGLVMGQVDRWTDQRKDLQRRLDTAQRRAEELQAEVTRLERGRQSGATPGPSPGVAESTSKPASRGVDAESRHAGAGRDEQIDRYRRRAERLRRQRDLALLEAEKANRHLAHARAYFISNTDVPYEELPGGCSTPAWTKPSARCQSGGHHDAESDHEPVGETGDEDAAVAQPRPPSLTPSLGDPLIDLS